MTTRKRDIYTPTPEEDAALTRAALEDPDFPDLTDADYARLRPAREVVPDLVEASRRRRGKQKTPVKEQVTLRLDPDVVAHFKGDDPKGWQVRLNQALRRAAFGEGTS